MKKRIVYCLILSMILLLLTFNVVAGDNITIYVNEQHLQCDA